MKISRFIKRVRLIKTQIAYIYGECNDEPARVNIFTRNVQYRKWNQNANGIGLSPEWVDIHESFKDDFMSY